MSENLIPHPDILTVNGKTLRENCAKKITLNPDVIFKINKPMIMDTGFINLNGKCSNSDHTY